MPHFVAFFLGLGIFIWLLVLLYFIFWIWMLVDCLTNPALDSVEKLIWVAVIFFLHLVGALVYFFVAKNRTPYNDRPL